MNMAKKALFVTSRINGLEVSIPPDAAGVLNRFRTKGDNELVFKNSNVREAEEPPMIVESESDSSIA